MQVPLSGHDRGVAEALLHDLQVSFQASSEIAELACDLRVWWAVQGLNL